MHLENSLQSINKAISSSEIEIKRKKGILEKVVKLFITQMNKDPLFNELYDRIFYGGNLCDDLRVGKPTKFNVNVLLRIPSHMSPTIDTTDTLGFVKCKIDNKSLDINENFLQMFNGDGVIKPTCVRAWMEDRTIKALKAIYPKEILKELSYTITVKEREDESAKTIFLQGNQISMEIAFIPCFIFSENQWPEGSYRSNPVPNKPEFFIVPKPPRYNDLLWRLSFEEQETELLSNKQILKQSLKLLKRLSDYQRHDTMTLYHIKTAFLWEVVAKEEAFNTSLAGAFLKVLEKYTEWLEKGRIPYFWNETVNLLRGIHPSTLENNANRLKRIQANLDSYTINEYMGVTRGPV